MEYYGTIGPACADEEVLRRMFRAGMTGVRMNLSHGGLAEHRDWLERIARAAEGRDVLVFAHGYFNHMVGRRLKADGWKLVANQGFKYWSQRRYEKRA